MTTRRGRGKPRLRRRVKLPPMSDEDYAAYRERMAAGAARTAARRELRRRLSSEQNHRCCYCGVETIEHEEKHTKHMPKNAATLEHIVPQSMGGGDTYENCVMACRACNVARANEFMEVHDELLGVLRGNDT